MAKIKNKQIINAAIPDNIDLMVDFLRDKYGMSRTDFENCGMRKKQNIMFDFVKTYPHILQLKLF